MASSSDIEAVLKHYYPAWVPPENVKEWNPCLCPDHVEDRPSCAVNYELGAVKCLACGFKGNAVSIIRRKEGLNHSQAVRYAERLSTGSGDALSPEPRGKPVRKVFGEQGAEPGPGTEVPARSRRRPSPWS